VLFTFAREAAGAASARYSLRPLFMGRDEKQNSGETRRENAELYLAVIPGWSEGPDPESRDSGFDASHRPGMTTVWLFEIRIRLVVPAKAGTHNHRE
jgi:hypothetical protein